MSQNETNKEFQLKKHDILCNKSVQYRVLDFIGEGCFGKVAKCINLKTSETVAIKINKDVKDHVREVKMLEQLRTLDPEKNNLVTFIDSFIFKGMSCIAFQILDRSLLDLMNLRQAPLTLNEIRPITRQLLVAFEALQGIGILHTDLKPDNVMLVNHQDDPFRVKLINFGLAIPASEVTEGMIMQLCGYRTPEVILGHPISKAIDMWGLGCLLAEMYFGQNLFNDESSYHVMKIVCYLLGQPEDHLLNAGMYTNQYFNREHCSPNSRWRLKTLKEYKEATGIQPKISELSLDPIGNLDETVEFYSNANICVENEDIMAFLSLLKWLLDPNAATRITPGQALNHCFVTMAHLVDHIDNSCYPNAAYDLMVVSPPYDSDEFDESTDSRDGFSDTDSSSYESADSIAYNGDPPTSQEPIQIQKHDILCNKSVQYRVLDFIEEGCFGKVVRCINLKTSETVAIKINKDVKDHVREVKMLEQLRTLDPEKNNLVTFIDSFIFKGMYCVAFQILDRSLLDLMNLRQAPLTLNEIRPITRQLLVAFEALQGIGILHTDLKPDNVMLVNHQDDPFRVKLINFGLAIPASEVTEGMIMQLCGYRAPEVILGHPISKAIDMWGLGCLLAEMYFGQNLFNDESSYHVMKIVCYLLGQPEDHLLNAGMYTNQYFNREHCSPNSRWRLKTLKEYKEATGIQPKISELSLDPIGNLDETVEFYSNANICVENEDIMAFLSLLKRLLDPNAATRITPGQALNHCFVTMAHLVDHIDTSCYPNAAYDLMVVSPPYDSDEFDESTDSRDGFSDTDSSSYESADSIAYNGDPPTPQEPIQIQKHDILCNKSVQYRVLDFIEEGCFGKVVRCINLKTSETVAIKINKDVKDHVREVKMLEQLRTLDPEKNNLVTFIDSFIFKGMYCVAFQILDRSLLDLMNLRQAPLTLNEIRPITRQLLVAFEALQGIGILHTDLKPDNVMLVNHQDDPFRVKLINFGLAIPASEVTEGMIMQLCGYRAPEVILGHPISKAIDMWGLGCLLAEMFFGQKLFNDESSYHVMKIVCHLLGQPEDHLLNAGMYTNQYFSREHCSPNSRWRLKTLKEYKEATGIQPKISEWSLDPIGNLDETVEFYSNANICVENEDIMAFLSLLKRLLDPNAATRITPGQALNHCFVTMAHLVDHIDTSCYPNAAYDLMVVSPPYDSDEFDESTDSRGGFSDTDSSSYESADSIAYNGDPPTPQEPIQIQKHDILCNKSVQYRVLDFIGEGCFGKVVKCTNLKTSETLAIKINEDVKDHVREVKMLEQLRTLDPEKNNLVRFIDSFIFKGMSCITFQILDRSLLDLINQRQALLNLHEIRHITRQLLVAFEALKGIGILHTDLKLHNVMLVNHQDDPFRVKVIDFGLAMPASEVRQGMIMQPCAYRAPEVTLGLPISEAIDMWALGCLLAEMYFGRNLFNGKSIYNVMKTVCHLLGQPEDHLLNAGMYTNQYFNREHCSPNSRWRLKTSKEYKETTGIQTISKWSFDTGVTLDEIVDFYVHANICVENEDTIAFLNLLKQLLDPNAATRITPGQALNHCFVTMAHLVDHIDTYCYPNAAYDLMVVSPPYDSDEFDESTDSRGGFSDTDSSSYESADSIAYNGDPPTPQEPIQIQKHDILCNKSVQYRVLDFIGEGCFGKVVKCINLKTSETVAIKINKDVKDHVREVKMLEQLRTLDPEKNNLVRFIDSFIFKGMSCITFQILDRSLLDLINQRQALLNLHEIRHITRQLLVAFEALKGIGILHTDLKLHNVMLVNHQDDPFRVKVIDFGLAMPASEVRQGMIMQPCAYRAPEVTLGLPISEAIDMWALGCLLAEMYFGRNLFNGKSIYNVMKTVCHLLGQPEDHLLNAGMYTNQYFNREHCSPNSRWRLKTSKEYKEATGIQTISKWSFDTGATLDEIVDFYVHANICVENEDTIAFLNLLKQLLDPNAATRITPGQALNHCFVTMAHLVGPPTPQEPIQIQKHDILCNKSVQYHVLDFIGEGYFGKVVKCINLKTSETVAIKINKDVKDHVREVKMLEQLRTLDPEKNNLVTFIDSFIFEGMSCIAFQMLDRSLWDLINQRQAPLTLNEIRHITRQLLVAFEALQGIGILYTDLKLDNVMLVNHQDDPFRVKLIDFGLAMPASEVRQGMIMQPCAYRAPEVTLGLPISEAVDMWALGCLLTEMYFGRNLFNGKSIYNVMQTVCHLLGQPEDHLLNAGMYTNQYFNREHCSPNSRWRLKTSKEYKEATGIQTISKWSFDTGATLDEIVDFYLHANICVENEDTIAFLNLLKQLLDPNAATRITPGQALNHCFVTMAHLVDPPTPQEPIQIQKHDILCNKSVQYRVLDFIGEGGFGNVVKCINLKTSETVAIKINEDVKDHVREVKMLEQLRTLDPEKNNLVTFIDSFIFKGMSCITFQILDRSLLDLINQRQAPLTLNEIRPITRQLLVAFEALQGIGILHTDLKPDNVMLVNHQDDPFRVKLIDFGFAMTASEVTEGMIMQPCGYRAPEVTLGLSISEAINMWGLGCLLAEMYFGQNLFNDESSYHVMKTVCHLLGQPEDHLLNAGMYTNQYFNREHCSPNSRWRLKTLKEYKETTGIQPKISEWSLDPIGNLDETVEFYSNANICVGNEDILAFSNLLKRLLDPNAATRITPGQALNHCFVTMAHLVDHMDTSSYPNAAYDLMVVSPPSPYDSYECDESTD